MVMSRLLHAFVYTHFFDTRCSTQTVASGNRGMDRSHTVGMCKYKAKYSFSLRQISLISLGRFCALKFSVNLDVWLREMSNHKLEYEKGDMIKEVFI
jgi:hypothetical protein